jgi:hypothetical protein
MQQRRFGLTAVGLEKLHALSVELLEVLKENMSNRTSGLGGWNFEKAHSILHKVRDRALSMGALITASVWPIVRTTRRYISRYCVHIPARVTCSTCGPWRRIWPMRRRRRVMALRHLDKECEAGVCELGIRYPTLQYIYAGKLNKKSIQVNIIYDIMFCNMISYLISCMIHRSGEEKRMPEQQTAMHIITMLARSAWM